MKQRREARGMPRKLKTFVTTAGFFDLAVAAPSMKAALEAWGAGSNLFHQGFAQETKHPDIVAATQAKPGVVLRRAVGTTDRFRENAPLPKSVPVGKKPRRRAAKPAPDPPRPAVPRPKVPSPGEQRQARMRERRIAAAHAALETAQRLHDARLVAIDQGRAQLDRRAVLESERWRRRREQLELRLQSARSDPPVHRGDQ